MTSPAVRPSISWLTADFTRIPAALYHDPDVYRIEQERLFRGSGWLYLGLEAELPEAGDFRTGCLGEVPVVYNRTADGNVRAFVNRCAHRNALVRREAYGRATDHTCVYHRWCYDLDGNLIGVLFKHGVGGKGGVPDDFRPENHGLQKLTVAAHAGLLFASFAAEPPPLLDYLGPVIAAHLSRTFYAPIRVIGYHRQRIRGNWKFYAENVRDQYHGSLLHQFQGTFLSRINTLAGSKMDATRGHNIIYALPSAEVEAQSSAVRSKADVVHTHHELLDKRFLRFIKEFPDDYGSTICAFFPNATFQQIRNSIATRQLRLRGPGEFDLFWTFVGFAGDTAEMAEHRLRQTNMAGPAGYISLEDGEAIELAHRATASGLAASGLVQMGGRGPIPPEVPFRINEQAIRGFWTHYARMTGLGPRAAA
jgi:anthranilate 1,2-dioxygenase large subunit